MALWIAKDFDGTIWCYKGNTPPTRNESTGDFTDNENCEIMDICTDDIPELTWENSPKELVIKTEQLMEDFEQKYKDLVKAVKELQEANPSDQGIQNWVNENVPELKESEDERIRKEVTDFLKSASEGCLNTSTPYKTFGRWLAWIEKQKSLFDANEVCKWLQDNVNNYVKGEYNHFHRCVDYDGTINTDSLIKDLKNVFK